VTGEFFWQFDRKRLHDNKRRWQDIALNCHCQPLPQDQEDEKGEENITALHVILYCRLAEWYLLSAADRHLPNVQGHPGTQRSRQQQDQSDERKPDGVFDRGQPGRARL